MTGTASDSAPTARPNRHRITRRGLLDGLVEQTFDQSAPDLHLSIAGLSVEIRSDDVGVAASLARALARFATTGGGRADARLDLRLDPRLAIWADESAEPRAERRGDRIAIEHRDFVGVVSADAREMLVVHPRYVLAVENALRVLYALLLMRNDGLLLHAAGVARGEDATVLFGRSGSGKSTVARLARGRTVLGDDLVALRRTSGEWRAHATPFGGRAARRRPARSARLRRLLRLRHGEAFALRPLPGARGVSELLQSVVLPAASETDRQIAFERCGLLQAEIGVQELAFPLDNGLWRWLDGRPVRA